MFLKAKRTEFFISVADRMLPKEYADTTQEIIVIQKGIGLGH